ncbi:MAG TPA: acVLRF1 family peptidyl-tRNA hydrolase [Trebonia sp.]
MKDIAASGGRWLDVSPGRFPGWIASFAERHGAAASGAPLTAAPRDESVTFAAPDGAVAECHPPFPAGRPPAGLTPAEYADAIAAHALAPRTVGVLLVRLGGYAAGVFTGSPPVLTASKTGSRLVHGRSAAGGWSQHRFARRREKQAAEALQAAASAAAEVFGRWGAGPRRSGGKEEKAAAGLDAVVLGGDKRAVAGLRDDPRLVPYLDLAVERFLTVPDPRLAVLKDTPRLFLAVRIRLMEPAS